MIDIDFRPSRSTLRSFGFIAFVAFGFLGLCAHQGWLMFSSGLGEARLTVSGSLVGLGLFSGLMSLVAPQVNRFVYVGMTLLALPIGFVVSHVLLAALFFLLIAPIGFLLKVFGQDPMSRRHTDQASYWTKSRPPRPRESYFRQF